MDVREIVLQLAEQATAKFPHSVDQALHLAVSLAQDRRRELEAAVMDFVTESLREAIYEKRSGQNRSITSRAGQQLPARAMVSEGGAAVMRQCLEYRIAGKMLGELRGRELPPLIAGYYNRGVGSLVWAHVMAQLAKVVAADQIIAEAVSEQEVARLYKAAKRRFRNAERKVNLLEA